MWEICLGQLADITDGRIRYGTLPPLAGALEPIRRIVLNRRQVRTGDVFWDHEFETATSTSRAEEALMRGAVGVVIGAQRIEPWAGRFVLNINEGNKKLARVIRCCPRHARLKTFVFDDTSAAEWRQNNVALEELLGQTPRKPCPMTRG